MSRGILRDKLHLDYLTSHCDPQGEYIFIEERERFKHISPSKSIWYFSEELSSILLVIIWSKHMLNQYSPLAPQLLHC